MIKILPLSLLFVALSALPAAATPVDKSTLAAPASLSKTEATDEKADQTRARMDLNKTDNNKDSTDLKTGPKDDADNKKPMRHTEAKNSATLPR
jgi:hypothetical protein